MNYQQTIEDLFARLPMYQRVGKAAFKKDLNNIIALCESLGDPQAEFNCIHVAGTNGKGSCSHMLASILQEAGYKTGLYTSPHLRDFRERIRVNGQCISESAVVDFVEDNKDLIDQIQPSFFEITVAMAFLHFAREKVDIAVIETGLGGRLDSTNIVTPELSVITNIGWDHMDMLGDTLSKIAVEKAGIIKDGKPVLIGERQVETTPVFEKIAADRRAPLHFAEDIEPDGTIGSFRDLNKRTVRAAVRLLGDQGFRIDRKPAEKIIRDFPKGSTLKGRWQALGTSPLRLCDTGHNLNGVEWIVRQLSEEKYKGLHMVWGCVSGKDHERILKLLPADATYYWCQPSVPRGYSSVALQQDGKNSGLNGDDHTSVARAFEAAMDSADEEDLIFVGGSTFVVADLMDHLDLRTC